MTFKRCVSQIANINNPNNPHFFDVVSTEDFKKNDDRLFM